MRFKLRFSVLALALGVFAGQSAWAGTPLTMHDLFEALKAQPQTQLDQLAQAQAKTEYQTSVDALYPKLTVFGDANHNSQLKNFMPVAPSALTPGSDFPFAYNLMSYGVEAGMPLYVSSLYALKAKAQKLSEAADIQARLNLLQNEALLVGYNADLKYSLSLTEALKAQRASLSEGRKTVKIKVDSGRSPRIELTNIDQHINSLDQKLLGLKIQRAKLRASIYSLTHIQLTQPIPMTAANQTINQQDFLALKVVDKKKQAAEKALDAAKGAYYPKVSAYARWSDTYGDAYNTHQNISRDFGTIGLKVTVPLFDASLSTTKQKTQQAIDEATLNHQKIKQELTAKAASLNETLKQLVEQKKLAIQSVKNQQILLKTAKVSYQTGRMTQEEYLRYEDKLSLAKAGLYQTEANWWHAKATLAFLYGNNIEELVK